MAVILAALTSTGGFASAQGVLAYSGGVAETTANGSRVIGLSGFDPALGTLTAVNLSYTLDVWQSIGLENLGSSPASYTASTTAILYLGGTGAPAYPPSHPIIFGHSGTLGAFDGTFDDAGGSGATFDRHYVYMPNTISVPASGFSRFETRNVVAFPAMVTASGALLADANIDFRAMTSAALTLNVTYDFVPIPESGSFALLAGVAALAAAVAGRFVRRHPAV